MEIITFNEHDSILDNFPFIKGLVNQHFINITDCRFYTKYDSGDPKDIIECYARVSDTEWVTEEKDGNYSYHDDKTKTVLTNRQIF